MTNDDSTFESYRDHIATVDAQGKRIWLRPEQPKGKFYAQRKYVSYLLLLVLFGLPFVEIGGQPLFLFNFLERHFIFFGISFGPQEFYLAGLMMLTGIVGIALFTVVFGRLFCGWICPQTIFMEMVYRRIEYWIDGSAAQQRKLDAAPMSWEKVRKRLLKHSIFFAMAVLIANTFLSYILGWREVYQIASEPIAEHQGGFAALMLFSAIFYGVFARLREQVCTSICPYGRMQSVLVDPDTIGVAYDPQRGEPRGKFKRQKSASLSKSTAQTVPGSTVPEAVGGSSSTKDFSVSPPVAFFELPVVGDCIDCGLCVRVCPTGIDIRNGFNQMECVHCTACIDACDSIMDKIERPRGLIRYASANGLAGKQTAFLNKRVLAYATIFIALISVNAALLIGQSPVSASVLRAQGLLAQTLPNGLIANLYTYQFINKTNDTLELQLLAVDPSGASIRFIAQPPILLPNAEARGSFFVDLDPKTLPVGSTDLHLALVTRDKQVLTEIHTSFLLNQQQ